MREIKFRSWNGERMQYGGFSVHATGDVLADSLHDAHPIAVMQYTGLKDLSGRDVYENDIVKLNDCLVSEVKFYGCGFGVVTKSIYANRDFDLHNIDSFEEVEVIGNIYQNPELLNG